MNLEIRSKIRVREDCVAFCKLFDILAVNASFGMETGAVNDSFNIASVLTKPHQHNLRLRESGIDPDERNRHLGVAVLFKSFHSIWRVHTGIILTIP